MPLPELNQLELQFLLLNDFRLVISSDEMQRYAEQLILFSRSSGMMGGVVDTNGGHRAATASGGPVMPSVNGSGVGVAAPMSAMGAIDAYGGKTPDEPPSTPSSSSSSSRSNMHVDSTTTPHHYPNNHHQSHTIIHHHHHQNSTSTTQDTESYEEDDAETEVGTEDGSTSGTTDDEPTIRAASVASRGRRRESIDDAMCDTSRRESGDHDRERTH